MGDEGSVTSEPQVTETSITVSREEGRSVAKCQRGVTAAVARRARGAAETWSGERRGFSEPPQRNGIGLRRCPELPRRAQQTPAFRDTPSPTSHVA